MPRNGSGTYDLPTNSWNPAINGVSATGADWQSLINDVETALTQSLSADGQTPLTGNLNAGNNKITALAAATATGQALRFEQLFSQGTEADIASAATVDIGGQLTNFLRVTGTTTITSFGTNYNGPRFLRFSGALTLTHNATTLILPSGASITTAVGDCAIVVPISGGWQVIAYQRADGTALVSPSLSAYMTKAANLSDVANVVTARANLGLVIGTNVASLADARMAQGTAVASTSGTAIDFTGIPSWAKEITVVFNAVSSNAATDFLIQIGTSSGIESSGYTSAASSGTTISTATNAFVVTNATSAASNQSGTLKLANVTGNTWAQSGVLGLGNATPLNVSAGQKALGGVLDRVRITTVSGATFDNGTINLLWK
jgi:hypothetical protein